MLDGLVQMLRGLGFGTDEDISGADTVDALNDWIRWYADILPSDLRATS